MLKEFIQEELQKTFEWGKTDCCSTADRWIFLNSGISPMYEAGFIFSTETEADAILNEYGNIFFASIHGMSIFKMTKKPIEGDVGLVKIFKGEACLAIKMENGWFSRNEEGIMIIPENAVFMKAWKICPEQLN